jgi:hypothetical protein
MAIRRSIDLDPIWGAALSAKPVAEGSTLTGVRSGKIGVLILDGSCKFSALFAGRKEFARTGIRS